MRKWVFYEIKRDRITSFMAFMNSMWEEKSAAAHYIWEVFFIKGFQCHLFATAETRDGFCQKAVAIYIMHCELVVKNHLENQSNGNK